MIAVGGDGTLNEVKLFPLSSFWKYSGCLAFHFVLANNVNLRSILLSILIY